MPNKSRHNDGFDAAQRLAMLKPGLADAILRVMQDHVGRDQSILCENLAKALADKGFDYTKNTRVIRFAINIMRHNGALILSTGGISGGFYLAENFSEVEDFCQMEFEPRAFDLLEQCKAMRSAARRRWANEQLRLI